MLAKLPEKEEAIDGHDACATAAMLIYRLREATMDSLTLQKYRKGIRTKCQRKTGQYKNTFKL